MNDQKVDWRVFVNGHEIINGKLVPPPTTGTSAIIPQELWKTLKPLRRPQRDR